MYGLDGTEFESRYCKVIFLYSETSRKALGSSQTPIQRIPVFFHGDEAAGAWRWLSGAEVKKKKSYSSTPSI